MKGVWWKRHKHRSAMDGNRRPSERQSAFTRAMPVLFILVAASAQACALNVDEESPFDVESTHSVSGALDIRQRGDVLYGLVSGRHRSNVVGLSDRGLEVQTRLSFLPEHWASDGAGIACASKGSELTCAAQGQELRSLNLPQPPLGIGFAEQGVVWVADSTQVTTYPVTSMKALSKVPWGPVEQVWTDHESTVVGLATKGEVWTVRPGEPVAARKLRVGDQLRGLKADKDFFYLSHDDDVVTVLERERFVVRARHQLSHSLELLWPVEDGFVVWSVEEEEVIWYPRWEPESVSAISLDDAPKALVAVPGGLWFSTESHLYRWSLPEDTGEMELQGSAGILLDDGKKGLWAWLRARGEFVHLTPTATKNSR